MARDITQCHPKLQEMATQLVSQCAEQGLMVMITDCVRDRDEQEACVENGYSSCHYPHSHHNWGTAFDICRNDGEGAYNDADGWFEKVGAIGQAIGLEWGGGWISPVDKPHFQLPDWGTGTAKLIQDYGTPDAFRQTWPDYTPADNAAAESQQEGEDDNMVCFFQVDGKGAVHFFDGHSVHALAHIDELNVLNQIYRDCTGKDIPFYAWESVAPWHKRLLDAINRGN